LRVLRRIFGPNGQERTKGWSKTHAEEFNNVYASPNNIRVIKSMRIGWVGNVAHVGMMTYA
jgi:hypothetical protein